MSGELGGKTILITGATNGIGLEASVELAKMGATLVMVGRDPARTERAVAEVTKRSGSGTVSSLLCDFSSQAEIRRLATEFRAAHDRLDVLINNAGLVNPTRTVTTDGIETTLAVNHLGYFLLTNLLLDLLEKSAQARIVNVASEAHRSATLDFQDLGFEQGYSTWKAYARSKLANVLFTRELSRRLQGRQVTVNCLHPGVVATGIWANVPWWAKPIIVPVSKLFFISAAEGGHTITHAATSPALANVSGEYLKDNQVTKTSRQARDMGLAAKLWDVSTQLVKLA